MNTHVLFRILFLVLFFCFCDCDVILYQGCGKLGWSCVKNSRVTTKYDISYGCQNQNGITLNLWSWRAPADVITLKIENCTSVELNFQCTGENRQIEKLHVHNVTKVNFTESIRSVYLIPAEMVFENVTFLEKIEDKTFQQQYKAHTVFGCFRLLRSFESFIMKNVSVGVIHQNGFFNLTEMSNFTWEDVTVQKMEASALQIVMKPGATFNISRSKFGEINYKSFDIRAADIMIDSSRFEEIGSNGISSFSYNVTFRNNSVGTAHPNGLAMLAQNTYIHHNYFRHLHSRALQSLGPGLLENSLVNFGHLEFHYEFKHNSVQLTDVLSLQPDWTAYKNVKSYVEFSSNKLPCTCSDLAWLVLQDGLGSQQVDMMTFGDKILHKLNKNVCLDAPCTLPVRILKYLALKSGRCNPHVDLKTACQKYRKDETFRSFLEPEDKMVKVCRLEKSMYDSRELVEKVVKKREPKYFTDEPFDDDLVEVDFEDSALSVNNDRESVFEAFGSNLIDLNDDNETDTLHFPISNSFNGTGFYRQYSNDVANSTKVPYYFNQKSNNYTNVHNSDLERENQKQKVKEMFEDYQNSTNKRFIYFKILGKYLTLN